MPWHSPWLHVFQQGHPIVIPATSAPTCTRRQMDPNPTSSTSRACAARWTTPSRTEHSTLTMRIFVAELTTTACPVSGRCFWLLFSAARSRLDALWLTVGHSQPSGRTRTNMELPSRRGVPHPRARRHLVASTTMGRQPVAPPTARCWEPARHGGR